MITKQSKRKKRVLLSQINKALYSFSLNPSRKNKLKLTQLTGESKMVSVFQRTIDLVKQTKSIKSLEDLEEVVMHLEELYNQNPYHLLNEKVQKQAHIIWIDQLKELIQERLEALTTKSPNKGEKIGKEQVLFRLCCVQFYRRILKDDDKINMLNPYYQELAKSRAFVNEVREIRGLALKKEGLNDLINFLLKLQDKYIQNEPHSDQLTMLMIAVIAAAQSPLLLEGLKILATESLHNDGFLRAKPLISAGLNALQIVIEHGTPLILKK